jgi:MFS family permease
MGHERQGQGHDRQRRHRLAGPQLRRKPLLAGQDSLKTAGQLKIGVFALEGLNSLATTWFFYDIYFYTRDQFKFGALQNLLLAAGLGAVYAVAAFFGGRFAQRFGYLTAVRWGTALMASVILIGSQVGGLPATIAVLVVADIGMCLTWPALEALMSEGEPPVRLQSLVGIYNVVWAVAGAFAYFTGGILMQKCGLKSIFFVPAGLLFLEMGLALWLERAARRRPPVELDRPLLRPTSEGYASPVSPGLFLKMAWLVNPLAYLSINTVVSTIPTLAEHFQFTPMRAGFVCSIWLFARAGAFVFLRLWPRWHYKFRFLAGSHIAMLVSFGAMLLVRNIWVLIASQVVFGLAIGLVYYSSLFYSMDVGETKGEHGGIHEAAIGAGNAAGPAMAAAALAFFPKFPGSGTAADCVLLLLGLGVLYWMRFRRKD